MNAVVGVVFALAAANVTGMAGAQDREARAEMLKEVEWSRADELNGSVSGQRATASVFAPREARHRPQAMSGIGQSAQAAAAPIPALLVIKVFCDQGESINDALQVPAEELVILVRGFCNENVEIRRDRVTLQGETAQTDGIRPVDDGDARQSALRIRSARRVRIENLSLADANWDGLRVFDSIDDIDVVNSRLESNGVRGLTLLDSIVRLTQVTITGNGSGAGGLRGGLLSVGSSIAICDGCEVTSNPAFDAGVGVAAIDGGSAQIVDSQVVAYLGVYAGGHGTVSMYGGSLNGSLLGAWAQDHSQFLLQELSYHGAINAAFKSVANLYGAQQLSSRFENLVSDDSFIELISTTAGDVNYPGSLESALLLDTFSQGHLWLDAKAPEVICSRASQLICDGGAVVAQSTCGLCPAQED